MGEELPHSLCHRGPKVFSDKELIRGFAGGADDTGVVGVGGFGGGNGGVGSHINNLSFR